MLAVARRLMRNGGVAAARELLRAEVALAGDETSPDLALARSLLGD